MILSQRSSGWTEAPLGELVTEVRYGLTAKGLDRGTHRLVRITDIRPNGRLHDGPARYVNADVSEQKKYGLKKGDLLIARSGATVGKAFIVREEMEAVYASYLIRIRTNQEILLPEFCFAFLQSPSFRRFIRDNQRGAAQPNVNAKVLRSCLVPVPSIAEQQAVVESAHAFWERFDEVQTLRADAAIDAARLHSALIADILPGDDGDEVALGEVCDIQGGLVDPTDPEHQNLLHVGGANLESGTGGFIDLKTAEEERLISNKFLFDERDVLYNKIRPYLRKVGRPSFPGLCSADMYPLRPDTTRISRGYLYYVLLSRSFTAYAIGVSNRAGMPKVNRKDLFAYRFSLPTLEQQEDIVERLDEAAGAALAMQAEMRALDRSLPHMEEAVLSGLFQQRRGTSARAG